MLQQGNQKGKDGLSLAWVKVFFQSNDKTFTCTKSRYFTRSAYVEFMRKEAADNALSLDGTSFMSRILKVFRYLVI